MSSRAEVDEYASQFAWIMDEIVRSLDGVTQPQFESRPIETGNSPFTIANHVIGATTAYALGFGCGESVTRDRKAEFESPATSVVEVTKRLRDLGARLTSALSVLGPERLDERLIPDPELRGTGPSHEISRRYALVESIRHAALHLGELRLTRDLATSDHH